jgi:hypothetical protein
VKGDPALIPGNIKSGAAIFGVPGIAIEASGTAFPDQVLSGQTFSNASGPATGTMADVGQQNFTPGTSDQAITQGYHNGTGKVGGDPDLTTGNIKSGITIFGVNGTSIQASGTATPDKVLSGQTFSSASGPASGTMTDVGAQYITPGTTTQTIRKGYHDGTGSMIGDPALVPGNIKTGAVIFGVTGTAAEWSGTAIPEQVLSGQTFYNFNGAATGSMPDMGALSITPGPMDQSIDHGYHNGNGKVLGSSNLISSNIKKGVTVFNVTGTYPSFTECENMRNSCFQDCVNDGVFQTPEGINACKFGCVYAQAYCANSESF